MLSITLRMNFCYLKIIRNLYAHYHPVAAFMRLYD